MFKGDKKKTEIERGFVEAAHDDDVAFFTNLRTTIESHALVNGQTQAKYKLSPRVSFTFSPRRSLILPVVVS